MSDEHGAPRPEELGAARPDPPSTPRADAAAPAWYPHPRRPGALRYWNGVAWVDTDATQGWYPDPQDRADLRFWTGEAWGDVLVDDPSAPTALPTSAATPDPHPSAPPIPAMAPNPRLEPGESAPSRAWVTSIVALASLVAGVVVGAVVTSTVRGGDEPGATATVTTTATAAVDPAEDVALTVTKVLSSRTLELEGPDGTVEVRLLGLGATTCDTNQPGKDLLKEAVVGKDAVITTITDPETGQVGAYVDVAGQDVGELLVTAGLATAAVGHPRAPSYDRAARAADPFCPPTSTPVP